MYNYLNIITTEENTEKKDGVISINSDGKSTPYLQYYSEKDDTWIPIDNRNLYSMSKYSDVLSQLIKRDWNITTRFFIDKKGNPRISLQNYDKPIPVINTDDKSIELSETLIYESLSAFESVYDELINFKTKIKMEDIEINLKNDYYNYLSSTRDLIEKSSSCNILDTKNNDYSNIINLNELIRSNAEILNNNCYYSIKIGISYVKNKKRTNLNFIFDPITINDRGDIERNDFIHELNKDITIEFNDGCLRLFSNSPEITENIIQYCNATYEKLI